jgi:RNA polymerase sigma-70 factor (ECF subfamily)
MSDLDVDPGPFAAVDDRGLMRRHVAGDPDAFGEIVRRHRDRLWAVALRTLSDPDEAADAVQDALVSAFRNADKYRGEAAVTTWLHRIVVNACLDRVRRRQARPASALPDDLDTTGDAADPHDRIDDSIVRLDVRAALDTLSGDQRAALVLVDMLGYSVEDAAAVLECPTGTVKSRCFRGRARLLPLLEHLRNQGAVTGVVPGSAHTAAAPAPGPLTDSSAADFPGGEDR